MITFKYLIIQFFHKTALLSYKIRLLLHAYHIFFPYNRLILQTSPTYVWHFVFQILSRLSKRLSFWILLLQTYFRVIYVIRIHFISSFFFVLFSIDYKANTILASWITKMYYAQDKALMCLWCCLSLVKHIHNINGWIISIPVSMAHKIKRKDTTT